MNECLKWARQNAKRALSESDKDYIIRECARRLRSECGIEALDSKMGGQNWRTIWPKLRQARRAFNEKMARIESALNK